MTAREIIYFFLLMALKATSVYCDCDENDSWMRHYSFKPGNMTIKWNFTNDSIQMLMIGKTTGWVALGFASSKSMNGADILIGWVDDKTNKTYLQDRYGDAKNQSLMDNENSYTLLNGKQNESSTIICWTRKLETCDKQDYPITFSTVRTFWAIGKEDPPQEQFDVPPNLGTTMGIQSLRLLSLDYPKPTSPDIKSIDFVARNVMINKDPTGTVYWCTHFTLPKTQKSHMVSAEPIVGTDVFHHYLLYECPSDLMEKFGWTVPKEGYSCFDYSKFAFQDLCITLLNGWAVGGTTVNYPPDIGFPFHSENKEKFYMLQSHYNVRNLKSPIKDSSGLRLYYTHKLRSKDGSVISFGINVSPFHLTPPNQKSFTNIGVCNEDCTGTTIPEEGIKVISVVFHSHLAGRQLRLRRIRNGKELEPLEDLNYDFDYQQQSFLPKPFDIMPGDKVITECVYDTSGRNYTTVGAFGTSEEMCLIFLYYEKHAELSWCVSFLPPVEILNLTEVGALFPLPKFCWGAECESIYAAQGVPNLMATVMLPAAYSGKKLVDYLHDYNWSPSKTKTLQDMYYKPQIPLCKSNDIAFNSTENDRIPFPTNFVPYKKPDICGKNTK